MVILLYATGCRVAVCTANFISIDWLWKNNASFVQDFPRKNQRSPRGSDFETSLLDYVEPYRSRGGLDVAALREFDFSAAKAVLIPSVPGFHTGAAMHRYGHMRLRAVLAREPLAPKFAQAPIVAQFSSLGSISEKWLADELRASMAAHAPPRGGAAAAAGTTNASAALMANASLPPLRIVWPTVESVRTSLEGWSAGGSLCCDTKNMKPMLQRYLHVWDGEGQRRHRAMPHIKSYLRAAPDGELAWCLITSANLSNAAWGQLQKGNTQLMIRHYEVSQQVRTHAGGRQERQRRELRRNICVWLCRSSLTSMLSVVFRSHLFVLFDRWACCSPRRTTLARCSCSNLATRRTSLARRTIRSSTRRKATSPRCRTSLRGTRTRISAMRRRPVRTLQLRRRLPLQRRLRQLHRLCLRCLRLLSCASFCCRRWMHRLDPHPHPAPLVLPLPPLALSPASARWRI
jgi:hypothetical protein